jgi:hypothetical protein
VKLNQYSSRFLTLLREFPAFRAHLREGPDPECFSVAFSAPSGSPFWVRTEEEERITIGFDAHHVHFGGWADSDDNRDFAEALRYIRLLMSGELRVAVWTKDDRPAGSVTLGSGEEPGEWGDCTLAIKTWD